MAKAAKDTDTTDSGAHLESAQAEVYGDDTLQQKGVGSRFAAASPAAKANMYVAEMRTIADEVIAQADSLLAAAKRLADASKAAGEHAQAAAREPPPPAVR